MKVLTIYAHHDPRSFCHAILQRFTEGLRDAGHASEVVDLYAIRFDPALRDEDRPNWLTLGFTGNTRLVPANTTSSRSLPAAARSHSLVVSLPGPRLGASGEKAGGGINSF
jgi:putative NADPH-quinone reductase